MSITIPSGQILRFTGVGVANSALYVLFAATLNSGLGLATVPSSVIAYALAAIFAYLAHKHLTFGSKGNSSKEISKFIASTALGQSLALAIPLLLQSYAPMISFVTVLVVVPLCSFLMMKFFVFRS